MADTYNIPKITVKELVEILTELYASAYGTEHFQKLPSAALWGPMGVGKSMGVREIAERLSERIGQPVTVTDIRLLNFSPVDLRGIPAADAGREFTVWLKPKIFDLPKEGVNLLFLDEISAAPQSLQAAAYQIALDKQIGEHMLPANCVVICAGNRTTDQSVAFRMPKALANRLMHFQIEADFQSWYEWAAAQELDARVIGYLAFDNRRLQMEAGLEELAFPTPRSWEFVSRLLQTTKKTPEEIHALVAGCIGVACAGEFEAWCRVYEKLPPTEEILSGKWKKPVKGADAAYAILSSMINSISNRKETITSEELENACRYAANFSADFTALFFHGLLQVEGMNLKLTKVPAFLAWTKRK